MKIRIQGNSIRYRLGTPKAEFFKKYGSVTETIQLGTGSQDQLGFILQESSSAEIMVQFGERTTAIYVPQIVGRAMDTISSAWIRCHH